MSVEVAILQTYPSCLFFVFFLIFERFTFIYLKTPFENTFFLRPLFVRIPLYTDRVIYYIYSKDIRCSVLKECGIKTIAACSRREVKESTGEKGTIHKTAVSRFVRFREY